MPNRTAVEREARRIIAEDYWDHSIADDAIGWATLALEAGFETPNVLMLAASKHSAGWFEIEPYFRAALAEIGVAWPERTQAYLGHARDIAVAVLNGAMDPGLAVEQLARYAVALGYPDDLMEFWALEDQLVIQYGPDRVTPADRRSAALAACRRFLSSVSGQTV